MTRGVYTLKCPLKALFFLDGSENIEAEWEDIHGLLSAGQHPNLLLQAYFNRYGWDGVVREILYIADETLENLNAVADAFRGGVYIDRVWPQSVRNVPNIVTLPVTPVAASESELEPTAEVVPSAEPEAESPVAEKQELADAFEVVESPSQDEAASEEAPHSFELSDSANGSQQ